MNPIRSSLRHPQVTLVLALLLFIVGVYTLVTMPRREDPKITIRTGLVIALYPGASSEEVEAQVTHPIEERLFHFAEVRREKTFSTSRNGIAIVNVELNENVTDADAFWSRLRLDMAELKQTTLPAGVRGPSVDSDFGDTVAVLIAIHGGNYGYRELQDYAERTEDALRRLPAVSKIHRIGEQQEYLDVSSSSARLAEYGINQQRVMQAIAQHSDVSYAGRVPSPLAKAPIEASGHLSSEDALRNLIVDVPQGAQPVHLGDLATVTRVYQDPSQYARVNGAATILLSVEMHEGNNIVDFGKDLRASLDQVQSTLPPGVALDLIADQPQVVKQRVSDFFREFGIAIVAVILVTMLLLPMRVALVSAVAIPVTVSVTFAMLHAAGIELHQVSISALITVLGMVVDDAIVIADNYVELLDRRVPRDDAAWRAASEMAVPVLTATLTIIASFAPLLLLSGSVGEFIRALPIAISIALAVSFVVAMLLTPITAHTFIRKGLHDHSAEATPGKRTSPLEYMQQQYNRIIVWAMQNRRTVLISGVVTFFVGLGILQLVREQFFPLAERDQFVMDVWLPEGARIEATDNAVHTIEGVLAHEPDVRTYASFLGFSAPRFYYNVNPQTPADNYAQILVNTRNADVTPKLVEQLRARLPSLAPEARIFVKELQQGQVMEAPVEFRVIGDDAQTLHSISNQIEEVLRHTEGATYVHTDWHEEQVTLGVHLRDASANRQGFTNTTVANQLAAGWEGAPVTTYWEGNRAIGVRMRLDSDERKNYNDVSQMYVQSPATGASVPLAAIADLKPAWQPGRIVRRNGVRTITVRAFAEGSTLPSEVFKHASRQIKNIPLPVGYRIEAGGEDENQRETFGEMQYALFVSLVLIFLILLLQFRTLADALIVMAAFPLALPGAAIGLFITHNAFGFTAFIGIISLGGLVVRNSIILIDYVHERMRAGVALEQATLEAGERRLRPIFLTTMAAAVGVTPMILSGSSLWSPLASVIAFGLLGSMFFTLVVIPVLFVSVHGRKRTQHGGAVIALLLAVLLSGTAASAQQKLSLDDAVSMALRQNRSVQLADARARQMRARVTQARADYFPQVTNQTNAIHLGELNSFQIPAGALGKYPADGNIPGKPINIQVGKQDSFLLSTTAAQPLTQFLKIHAGVSAAESDSRAATLAAEDARNQVASAVRQIYFQLLATERRKTAAELRLAAAETQLKDAAHAVESGDVLKVRALEAEAQQAAARAQLNELADAIDDQSSALAAQLALPVDTRFDLALPDDDPREAPSVDDALVVALRQNLTLKQADETIRKAQAGLSAARAEFVPDISLFAQHVYQNGVPLLASNSGAFGLRMEWTLSEFGKRTGHIKERRAELDQARIARARDEDELRNDVSRQTRKLRHAADNVSAASAALAARQELRRITEDQHHVQAATAAQLLDARAGEAEAEAQWLGARMQQAAARAELERMLGQR